MRVLLPPSEGKADGGDGPPLDLAALSFPALTPTRRRVLTALRSVCARPPAVALGVLGLGAGQAEELEHNRRLRASATMPASQRYTGVLYEALGLATLPPGASELAARSLVICSGLWGALRLSDPIPRYRLSIGVRLPSLGALAGCWRPAMAAAVGQLVDQDTAEDGLVLDLRSAPYAAAWRPAGALAERVVAIRVLAERMVDGERKRSVVSHHNKAAKGRLLRDLLTAEAQPRSAKELRDTLSDLGHVTEGPADAVAAGRPSTLDVIVPG